MKGSILTIEQAEQLAKYDELKKDLKAETERKNYWKTEYDRLVIMLKERDKNYMKTNSLKDKRIKELETKIKELESERQPKLF